MLRLKIPNGQVILLVICTVIVLSLRANGQQILKTTERQTKLWVYTPPRYTKGAKAPLIIFLHGKQLPQTSDFENFTEEVPPLLIARKRWPDSLPFIVISPILENSTAWQTAHVDQVIRYAIKHYSVDVDRIYLTGVSEGANACWNYVSSYPTKIAAIIPVSFSSIPSGTCNSVDIPVWAFVPPNSPKGVDNLETFNSCEKRFKAIVTSLPPEKSDKSSTAYGLASHNIYAWLLRFKSADLANCAPYVNAGPDRTIALPNGDLNLAGYSHDADGTITRIHWKQVGGTPLNMSGQNSAFMTMRGIKPGTYDFQLTATDNKGKSASDNIRITVQGDLPQVAALQLCNGRTGALISTLHDGMVVNKTVLGINEYNVRAVTSPGVVSVRFSVNENHSVSVTERSPHLLVRKGADHWTPTNGTCVICATPYIRKESKVVAAPAFCQRIVFTTSAADKISRHAMTPIFVRAIDDVLVSNIAAGNQWVCNGEDIPGATFSIFKPERPGEYYVRHLARSVEDVSNIVPVNTIKQEAFGSAVEVYPGEKFLQVRAESIPSRSYYKIYRSGKIVQEGALTDDNKIMLSNPMARGTYVLFLNGRTTTRGINFVIH